jgi:hypothetical protein
MLFLIHIIQQYCGAKLDVFFKTAKFTADDTDFNKFTQILLLL